MFHLNRSNLWVFLPQSSKLYQSDSAVSGISILVEIRRSETAFLGSFCPQIRKTKTGGGKNPHIRATKWQLANQMTASGPCDIGIVQGGESIKPEVFSPVGTAPARRGPPPLLGSFAQFLSRCGRAPPKGS